MRKLAVLAGFVLAAIVAAGLSGIVHDQISYTVSPEYYTRFKFLQFRMLDASAPERLRTAQVGWQATWWMGLVDGLAAGNIDPVCPPCFIARHAACSGI